MKQLFQICYDDHGDHQYSIILHYLEVSGYLVFDVAALQALVGAPGALASRVEVLWPAMLAIVEALEVLSHSGTGGDLGHDPAAARETCIEALLAAARYCAVKLCAILCEQ